MVQPPTTEAPVSSAEILYGVAGWSYRDWEGIVYPAGADAETKLLAVASSCDLLEVNTTFYATPRPAMTAAWARRLTRAGLPNRMVVKLNRVFTHEEQFGPSDVAAVRDALAPLDQDTVVDRNGVEQPRLLGLLIQFPYYFRLTPEHSQRLERLAEEFADWTRIVELRHRSWAKPVAFKWLAQRGFCLANIDLPAGTAARRPTAEQPDAAPPRSADHAFPPQVAATGPVGYLRLHGRNATAWFDRKAPVDQKYNYLYAPDELNDLADRIRELAGRVRTVVVVGNNHYRGKALATVLSLAHLVEGRRFKLPATMLHEYPPLAQLAEPAEPVALPPTAGPRAAPPTDAPEETGPAERKRTGKPGGRAPSRPAARPPRPRKPPTGPGEQLNLFD